MDKKETKQHLKNIDRLFSLYNMTYKEEAWKDFFSEDAVMATFGHKPNIEGRDEIFKAMQRFYKIPDLVFKWEPLFVDVSEDLTLGYVTGIYERTFTYNKKKCKETGKYTNIWKKINDEWKIVFDMGNAFRECITNGNEE